MVIYIYITGIRVLLLFTIIRSVTFAKNDQIDHGCAFLFLKTLSFFIDQKTINTLVICSGIMLIYVCDMSIYIRSEKSSSIFDLFAGRLGRCFFFLGGGC